MFFQFDYSTRNIFNSDKDKFLVISYIIFNTNYADMFNGLNNGECYVSYKILGDSTGVSFSKLKRILKELEADGFIEWVYKSKSRHIPSILSLKNVKVNDKVEIKVNDKVNDKVNVKVNSLIVNGLNGEDDKVNDKVNVKVNDKVNVKVNDILSIKHINNSIENSIKDMGECLLMNEDNSNSEHQKDSIINELMAGNEHQYGLGTDNQELSQGSNTVKAKKVKVSEEQIESIWALYINKKGKATAIKKIPKLIEQYGYDQVQRAVERYTAEIKQKNTAMQYVKHGDTFFNSGYMDYLDTNYNQEQQLEAEGHNKFGMYEHNDDMDEMEKLALERRKRLAEERQQRNNT